MRTTILSIAVIGLLAANASATVLVPTDLATLSREAAIIVRGEVIDVESRWTEDRRTIETVVTLATDEYLKGQPARTLQFRVPGGTLGRLRSVMLGAPRFDTGQQVIVFLGSDGPRVPHVLGLNQGVYRVGVSQGGRVVSPPPVMPGVTGPVTRGASTRVPAPLNDFEREVRRLAEAAQ